MWNDTHSALLKKIISGTDLLKQNSNRISRDGSMVLHSNSPCLFFRDLIDLHEIRTKSDLTSIHNACKFLFQEFGDVWINKDIKAPTFPIIKDKISVFGSEHAGYSSFSEAYAQHLEVQSSVAIRGGIDCLFVTALPTEFLAIVRRMDHYIEGSDPDITRGFEDSHGAEDRSPGWIHGGITRKLQTISVAVVCASIYGPHGSSSAVAQFVSARHWVPRHIIVVGIGASLGNISNFALGDIAYSTGIDDITCPKYAGTTRAVPETAPLSEVGLSSAPNWKLVPKDLKGFLEFKSNKLLLSGILEKRHVRALQRAFAGRRDKEKIQDLFVESQKRVEVIDFQSNLKDRPCPAAIVQKASEVASDNEWRSGIQLRPPRGSRNPKVVPSRVLSGSALVKAYGVRRHLTKKFKGRLLLEMEGAGVATYCTDNKMCNPVVIKSACDWATPEKEKSWQPYCADVAAAFAVEVALRLAEGLKGKP